MASCPWRLYLVAFIISLALLSETCKSRPWIGDETGTSQDMGIIGMRRIFASDRQPEPSPPPPKSRAPGPWSAPEYHLN
ncbi:hypothetical protein AMTRI_Chr13g84970 [Amborella trichopoda]